MLNPEQVVNDRYVVIRTLGRGGLSVVYEVRDLTLPQTLALKAFTPPRMGAEELAQVRAAFQREVEILSRLSHPRLPRVVDAFHWQGGDYMVMERIEGETLASRITAACSPFDEATCHAWALQVLEVLEYLHGQSPPIIFRDIKPENLMIDPAVGIRFVDFGIARLFNPVKSQDTVFMGTPGFAAPEQFRQRQSDPRSDLYSLGATLHYLLTLRDPALSPFAFEPVSMVNPSVSTLFEQVLQRALEIKPENRFQTASDMARVLRGEVSIAEVTRSVGLVVQPRELSFDDLARRGEHVRAVDVHVVGGEAAECTVSCPHDGVIIEPARFTAARGRVRVKLRNDRFPRGEMVQSALAFSIPQASVTVPLTVAFRPTFVQSLPPALLGLIVLLFGGMAGAGAFSQMQTMTAEQRLLWTALALLTGATILSAVAAVKLRRADALGFAGFVALALSVPLLWFTDGQTDFSGGGALDALWPGALALASNATLLLFCTLLSPRQRQRVRPMLLAGYFGFPASALIMGFLADTTAAERALVTKALIWVGFSLGAVFLLLHRWMDRLQEREALGQDRASGGALAVGALFWVLLAAGWIWTGRLLGTSRQGVSSVIAQLAQRFVELPSALVGGESRGEVATGVMALLAAVLTIWASRAARGRRLLSGLVGGGFALAAVLSFSVVHLMAVRVDEGAARDLLSQLEKSPGRVIQSPSIRARFPHLVDYVTRLSRAIRLRLDGVDATAALQAGRKVLLERGAIPPAIDSQLRFLVRDAMLAAGYPQAKGVLPDPPPALAELSTTGLRVYAGTLEVPRPVTFFVMYHGCGTMPLSTDLEVAAAVLAQRVDAADIEGRFDDADREARLLRAVLDAAPSPTSPPLRFVAEMFSQRSKDLGRGGDRRIARGHRFLADANPLALAFFEAMRFRGMSLDERFDLLALVAPRSGVGDVGRLADLRGDIDERTWKACSELAAAYGRNEYARCLQIYNENQDVLWQSSSPFIYRVVRTCFLLSLDWRGGLRYDARLRATLRAKGVDSSAPDDFLAAWSHDMIGEHTAATVLYRSSLEKTAAAAAQTPRTRLVRARLESGLLPSLVYVLHRRVDGGLTMTIVGQGVPAELIPLVLETYDTRDAPHVLRTSDNITLEHDNQWNCGTSVRHFYKVRFKDPETEKIRGAWRFWISYPLEHFEGWPSALTRQQQAVFNSVFAVDFGQHPPDALFGYGRLSCAGRWFLVASRHRIEPHFDVFGNSLDFPREGTPDITPDEVFELLVPTSRRAGEGKR